MDGARTTMVDGLPTPAWAPAGRPGLTSPLRPRVRCRPSRPMKALVIDEAGHPTTVHRIYPGGLSIMYRIAAPQWET